MATEKLILELNAKVDDAIKDLDTVKDSLSDADREADKLGKSFKAVGNAASTMVKAALAAAAAITAIAVATAKADRTMGNLAVTAKMSKEEFKGLAFAFGQFDVDAKGAADSLNDVSERLGEFVATFRKDGKGTGAFQDFADVMGLSDAAAAAFAMTLQEMSPEDAIVRMVDAMEDANVHGSEMSFVLKSMSNDLEYTSQLFRNNGEDLENLRGAYTDMSESLQLTTQQSEDIAKMAGSFDLLTAGLGESATMITATLAPTLDSFFNSIIEIVPQATNAIIDFINRFRDIGDLSNIRELEAQLDILEEKRATAAGLAEHQGRSAAAARKRLIELDLEILAINEKILEVKEAADAADIARVEAEEGGKISGKKEFDERLKEHEKFTKNKIALDKKYVKERASLLRIETSQSNAALNEGLRAAKMVNSALLEDNKLVGAGLIVADTAQGIMKAFAQLGAWAFPAAAAIAVQGIAQLANLNSSGRGGGSIGTVGSAPTTTSDGTALDASQGASLSATDASGSSAVASNITLEIDGEVIASIVYDNIAKLEQDGVIS